MPPDDGPAHEGGDAESSSEQHEHDDSRSKWMYGAVFVGLGAEFVGITIGGLFLGYAIDTYLETTPVAIVICFVLSLAAVALHIYRMLDLT